jgi:hypothetical protein
MKKCVVRVGERLLVGSVTTVSETEEEGTEERVAETELEVDPSGDKVEEEDASIFFFDFEVSETKAKLL